MAEIRVGTSSRGEVNRRVLGQNVLGYVYVEGTPHKGKNVSMQGSGLWDPATHAPVENMMQLLRDVGPATMRWPGGCGVHRFNWKKTVGPMKGRPNQAYGLPEFLRCCKAVGARPILTLADFWGEPEDFADIVEYLNAPVGQNPNGGKDWAAVRAGDGHREPYNVVWFEYGNETYHGDHGGASYTPAEYADRYRRVWQAMKAVDNRIKLGAVLQNGYSPHLTYWTQEVIRHTSDIADFYIHHAYLPGYHAPRPSGQVTVSGGQPSSEELYALAFAAARQFDTYYSALNRFIRETTGRLVPLAITELNGHFVQGMPVPCRLSLGTAVQMADLIQVLMDPRHNIDSAQYWQFANEYWGMIQGYEPPYDNDQYWKFSEKYWGVKVRKLPYLKRPAYYMYKMYNDHLGETLLDLDVLCEGYDTEGGFNVLPASGHPRDFRPPGEPPLPVEPKWEIRNVEGAEATIEKDDTLFVNITTDRKLNYYHASIPLPAEASTGYIVTAEIRTSGIQDQWGARIDVQDGRGFNPATHSWAGSNQAKGTDWTAVQCRYTTLPDAKGIRIVARRLSSWVTAQEPSQFWIRNISIQQFQPFNSGRVPYLAALATRRDDQSVSVMIINRNVKESVRVKVTGVHGKRAWAETLSGPAVDATNEDDPSACVIRALPVAVLKGGMEVELPPHSLTAVRVEVR